MLTIHETAKRLSVSVSLVYRLIASGELASYEIATCKRVSEEDLASYLETRKKRTVKIPEATHRHF